MVTKSSREMQKDREKIRPPFGGLKFCQGTHYLPLTKKMAVFGEKKVRRVQNVEKVKKDFIVYPCTNVVVVNGKK